MTSSGRIETNSSPSSFKKMELDAVIQELKALTAIKHRKPTSADVDHLLNTLEKSVADENYDDCYAETLADALIDISWEECNVGHWSQVPETPKAVYAQSSLYKVLVCLNKAKKFPDERISYMKQAISSADLGLMLGKGYELQLTKAASMVTQLLRSYGVSTDSSESDPESENVTSQNSADDLFLCEGLNSSPISKVSCPSVGEFSAVYFHPRLPVVLSGCMDHWPALKRWKDIDYLLRVAGPRTVPVEIGSSYTQNDWGMVLTSIQDFIEQHILKKAPKVGYLAQHQLFDQIPELRSDIIIPDYCCLTDSEVDDDVVSINAWFGPANTVTPLHYDPKHNLLCQVVGTKRILLFSPEDSENLYPHDESMLNNTAKVDPYVPDYDMYPKFKDAVVHYCTLRDGEMLYIPPKWWHHVQSLDVSFSVSFWWE